MTSVQGYGPDTTGTEVASRFSEEIRGKTIVITGVSPKSLGETLAVTICRHEPAHLILASRTTSKLHQVQAKLDPSSRTKVTALSIDLSSQTSVRTAASSLLQTVDHIDILINNAGISASTHGFTADGIELQFGTNHIGHFLFTSLLLPKLTGRVINVSSVGYRLSPIRFHDYNFEGKQVPPEEMPPKDLPSYFTPNAEKGRPYVGFCAYGQSKTANILHVVGLKERGVRAFALHPGTIWTDLVRNLSEKDLKIIEGAPVWKTHDQGIATTMVAAFDPALDAPGKGVFLSDCQFEDVLPWAKSPELAERLWRLSESLVNGNAKL